jgi:hypothetical protein
VCDRIHVGDAYGDIPRGVFVVRGENVVLLGEIGEPFPLVVHKYYFVLTIFEAKFLLTDVLKCLARNFKKKLPLPFPRRFVKFS